MKQNILLLLLFFCLTGLTAQEMEFTSSPVVVDGVTPDMFEGVGHSTILNTATTTRDFRWTLNVVDMEDAWQVAFCDKNLCYDPLTTTEVFTLDPDSLGRMDVHVYPNAREGYAVIEIMVVDTNNLNLTTSNLYYFNRDPATSTEEPLQQRLKVYPNPSNGLFSVKGSKGISTVHVYSLTGAKVRSFEYGQEQWYDITDLARGTYLVRLVDRKGQEMVTKLMNKF